MAQPMPESVKTARVGVSGLQTDTKGFPFEVPIARDEVMILLAIDYYWHGVFGVANNLARYALWRKTEGTLPGTGLIYESSGHQDMIWSRIVASVHVAESIKQSGEDFITLPWPLILIRSPRLFIQTTGLTAFVMDMRLWYLLRDVNDVDLAKLMVKDHA